MTNTGGNMISIANCCYNGNSMEDGSFFSNVNGNVNGNKNGMRSMYLFPGGYCNLNDPTVTNTGNPGTDSISYHYYNKDHLGNNREVINESGTIEQVVHYYPFGTPFTDGSSTNIGLQPYLYGNKELDMMHGLNTYDFGARNYNPLLPMWDKVDPKAGDYPWLSPYNYCMNNPIKLKDIDGNIVRDMDGNIVYVTDGTVLEVRHPSNETAKMEIGYVFANDKTPILVMRNVGYAHDGWTTNCHGTTFLDGKFWLNNDQVLPLVRGDGYELVSLLDSKSKDKVLYIEEGNVIGHSMTIVETDNTITGTFVYGQGGLETENHKDKYSEA